MPECPNARISYVEFWDLYKASNNTHMNGAPVTMLHTCANLAQGDIIMLFTDKEYAGVSHTTFEKNTAFENLFYEVPTRVSRCPA